MHDLMVSEKPASALGHTQCDLATEMVLSVATCTRCGALAKYLVACDSCGSTVCQTHYNDVCLICGRGRWTIQCKYLEEPLSHIVDAAEEMYKGPPKLECLSPLPSGLIEEVMAIDIRKMVKYCSSMYGPGIMTFYAAVIPAKNLTVLLKTLEQQNCIASFNVLTGFLACTTCTADLSDETIQATSPIENGISVEYTPFSPTKQKISLNAGQ
jgi:hypothetical protein